MKRVSQWRSRVDTCICGSSGKGSSGKRSAGSNLKLSPFLTWRLWLMAQLCAAIWSNILKSWQRGAGASSGKRNQVIIRNQISARRGAINTELCFTLHCPLCTWDSLWRRRKARPSPATRDGWAELWVKGRASSSALSAVWSLHRAGFPSLHAPPLFIYPNPKFHFVINWHRFTLEKSHCSTRRTGFVQPGLQPRPEERRAELPGWGPLM